MHMYPFISFIQNDPMNNESLDYYCVIETDYFLNNYNEINQLYEQWYMETPEYTTYLQWIPNEILEDLMDYLVKIEVQKKRRGFYWMPPYEMPAVKLGWCKINPMLRDKLLKIKNISVYNPDAIKCNDFDDFNKTFTHRCVICHYKTKLPLPSKIFNEIFYNRCSQCGFNALDLDFTEYCSYYLFR